MANNLNTGQKSSNWVKINFKGYRNVNTDEVVYSGTKTLPFFDWQDSDTPLVGGYKIHKERNVVIKYPRNAKLKSFVSDRGDRAKLNDVVDEMLGPSNILYRTLPSGSIDKRFSATEADIGEILEISEKKAREFINRMIKLNVIRKVEHYSKKLRKKTYLYVVNPCIFTFSSKESVFLFFVFEDLMKDIVDDSLKQIYRSKLLDFSQNFETNTDVECLVKDFLECKASEFEII